MTDNKFFPLLVVVVVAAALLFSAALVVESQETSVNQTVEEDLEEPEYVSKVFDKNKVTAMDIKIDQADFNWLIENAGEEEYRSCDVTVNGTTFYNVGIRPKGNSSLGTSNSGRKY